MFTWEITKEWLFTWVIGELLSKDYFVFSETLESFPQGLKESCG